MDGVLRRVVQPFAIAQPFRLGSVVDVDVAVSAYVTTSALLSDLHRRSAAPVRILNIPTYLPTLSVYLSILGSRLKISIPAFWIHQTKDSAGENHCAQRKLPTPLIPHIHIGEDKSIFRHWIAMVKELATSTLVHVPGWRDYFCVSCLAHGGLRPSIQFSYHQL